MGCWTGVGGNERKADSVPALCVMGLNAVSGVLPASGLALGLTSQSCCDHSVDNRCLDTGSGWLLSQLGSLHSKEGIL